MASEITLPELGENVEEGVVVDIRVKEGDGVSEGDILMEVEAGKSTVEVPASVSGTIVKVLVKQGQDIQTGQALFEIKSGEKPDSTAKKEDAAQIPETPANDKDEAKTDKVAKNGDRPPQKQPSPPARSTTLPAAQDLPVHPNDKPGELVPASPATRLLARELGVELSQVDASGRSGRITQEDVKSYVRRLSEGAISGTSSGLKIPPLPDFSKFGSIEHQPLDTIRKETAKAMTLAWSLIPHVTQHDAADITDLEAFRKSNPAKDVKLTITAFAIKAAAIALGEMPRLNSSLDVGRNQLILKRFYNIGVAVDTEHGLLVPVVRDADKKSVEEIAEELTEVAERARSKKITSTDLTGGTFTITNLGGIGGTAFTPIVKYPEVAILGLSRARQELTLQNDEITARLMLPLSLSYDHRVVDGADAARFTRRIANMLEKPLLMLLHA